MNLELKQCHPEVHMATLGKDNLLKHLTKNIVESVDVNRVKSDSAKILCEPCIHEKQSKHPETRAGRPLKVVHSGV